MLGIAVTWSLMMFGRAANQHPRCALRGRFARLIFSSAAETAASTFLWQSSMMRAVVSEWQKAARSAKTVRLLLVMPQAVRA